MYTAVREFIPISGALCLLKVRMLLSDSYKVVSSIRRVNLNSKSFSALHRMVLKRAHTYISNHICCVAVTDANHMYKINVLVCDLKSLHHGAAVYVVTLTFIVAM